MNIEIRPYTSADTAEAIQIWNCVVEEGAAFPQTELLTEPTGDAFSPGSLSQESAGIRILEKLWVCTFSILTM